MKAKIIMEFSEACCQEISKKFGLTSTAELEGLLKGIGAMVMSDAGDDQLKVLVEMEE